MLELIPFRGRVIDSNYFVYCKCCKQRQRLWYGSAKKEMRDKMEKGLDEVLDCPACKTKKGARSTVQVMHRMHWSQAVKDLYMMSLSTGIDYEKADRDAKHQNKMNAQLEEDRYKTEMLLKQFNK